MVAPFFTNFSEVTTDQYIFHVATVNIFHHCSFLTSQYNKTVVSNRWCLVLRITAATIHLYFHYLDVIMIPLSSLSSTMGEEQMLNEAGDENSVDLNL